MPERTSVAAVAGLTVIAALVPLIEPVTVSVAVRVCEPAVLSVARERVDAVVAAGEGVVGREHRGGVGAR